MIIEETKFASTVLDGEEEETPAKEEETTASATLLDGEGNGDESDKPSEEGKEGDSSM